MSPEELGRITAKRAFEDCDLNHDGRLSFDEFQRWYKAPTGPAVAATADAAPSWVSLKEVRRLTGLEKFSAEEVCTAFLYPKVFNDYLAHAAKYGAEPYRGPYHGRDLAIRLTWSSDWSRQKCCAPRDTTAGSIWVVRTGWLPSRR